jgi:chromosome segregation ATPase
MDSLDLEQVIDEIVPRGGESTLSSYALARASARPPARLDGDDATAALGLVSEAAAAIRELERESAQAVARARNVANVVKEKLERAETRADRAEESLRQAQAQIEELSATVEQTRNDLEALQSLLSVREAELAASTRRADDAETAIHRIMDAIRTQLPLKLNIPTE